MTEEEILAQQQAEQLAIQQQQAQQAEQEAAKGKEGPQYQFDVGVIGPTRPTLPAGDKRLTRPPNFQQPTTPVVVQGILAGGGGGGSGGGGPGSELPAPGVSGEVKQLVQESLLREGLSAEDRDALEGGSASSPPSSGTTTQQSPNQLAREGVFNQNLQESAMPKVPVTAGKTTGDLQQNLEQSAQNYRDLVAKNAPPDQRAAAKQQYADALEAKALAGRQAGGAPTNPLTGRSRPMLETGAMYAAQAFGKPPYGNPELSWGPPQNYEQSVRAPREERIAALAAQRLGPDATPAERDKAVAEARANWNKLTPEQQDIQYYNEWKNIPQKVPSIGQETAIRNELEAAAKIDRSLSEQIRDAREGTVDEKGRKVKGSEDPEKAARLEEKRRQYRIEKGFLDPTNPTAGLNRPYATQVARDRLLGSGASLTELAKQQRVGEEQAKTAKAQPKQTSEQEKLQAAADARAAEDRARIEWENELRRRQFAQFLGKGNLTAAY